MQNSMHIEHFAEALTSGRYSLNARLRIYSHIAVVVYYDDGKFHVHNNKI